MEDQHVVNFRGFLITVRQSENELLFCLNDISKALEYKNGITLKPNIDRWQRIGCNNYLNMKALKKRLTRCSGHRRDTALQLLRMLDEEYKASIPVEPRVTTAPPQPVEERQQKILELHIQESKLKAQEAEAEGAAYEIRLRRLRLQQDRLEIEASANLKLVFDSDKAADDG